MKTVESNEASEVMRQCVSELEKQNAELASALEAFCMMFDKNHAISRFNWGASALRAEDIRELNEVPLNAKAILARIRKEQA